MATKSKPKKPKYNPADKFAPSVDEGMKMYDKDGREVPAEPRTFADLPYDVDDNGNPLPPPDEG